MTNQNCLGCGNPRRGNEGVCAECVRDLRAEAARYREALERIAGLNEREGDLGEGPGYWGAIGECADIAKEGLDV